MLTIEKWIKFAKKCKHRESLQGSSVYLCVLRDTEESGSKQVNHAVFRGDCERENCCEGKDT